MIRLVRRYKERCQKRTAEEVSKIEAMSDAERLQYVLSEYRTARYQRECAVVSLVYGVLTFFAILIIYLVK